LLRSFVWVLLVTKMRANECANQRTRRAKDCADSSTRRATCNRICSFGLFSFFD
jgi:hypothetical protein